MSEPAYRQDTATAADIAAHLAEADFVPPLEARVDVAAYAVRLARQATRFEAWSGRRLVGLLAVYCNDREARSAFLTNLSVARDRTGQGIATRLLERCIAHATAAGMREIRLEVSPQNAGALALYDRHGFVPAGTAGTMAAMSRQLEGRQ